MTDPPVRGSRRWAVVALCLAALACGTPEQPEPANGSPGEVALALFAVARNHGDDPARVERFVDPSAVQIDPGALFEALDRLADVERPRVVASEPLDGLNRTVVDVEGERPGPSLVAFTVQAAPRDDASWRVVWFAGPGVEWPSRPRPRGDAVRSSPAPDER